MTATGTKPNSPQVPDKYAREKIADLERRLAASEARERRVTRYQRLKSLREEGYVFDLEAEVEQTAALADADFTAWCERQVTKYAREDLPPVGQGLFVPESKGRVSEEKLHGTARSIAEAENITNYDVALGKARAALGVA